MVAKIRRNGILMHDIKPSHLFNVLAKLWVRAHGFVEALIAISFFRILNLTSRITGEAFRRNVLAARLLLSLEIPSEEGRWKGTCLREIANLAT
ncbi:unnamed protein product [Toxocara canis]|uniref:Bestrophin homolog n=1 Tax=Toxocara canis TaxID=6265 RepID=A0A183URV1_TOXCA|nr:unnamed protein product [Toxocara canis]